VAARVERWAAVERVAAEPVELRRVAAGRAAVVRVVQSVEREVAEAVARRR
jgi:hypothetical protein